MDEFKELVARARRDNPVWFGLEADPPASDDDVGHAEGALGVSLPAEYREFVKQFGGGYFAFANVFSVERESGWSIVQRNRDSVSVTGSGFIAVSDNGVGDYYGFCVRDGKCESRVSIYDHSAGAVLLTEYGDLYEFLASKALSPA